MFREIKMYETENGKVFKTSKEAEVEEEREALSHWYEHNKLYGYDGSDVDWETINQWLRSNSLVLGSYLRSIKDV